MTEIFDGDENTDLGACCGCETTEGVRNIMCLEKKAVIAGHGWECFQCGLPSDGAVAVLCDECLEKYQANENFLKIACRGYPAIDGRIEIEKLTGGHGHDMSKHSEELIEKFTDYFLRYLAEIPANEINLHQAFSTECPCYPEWTFDQQTGWHNIIHKSFEN